MVIDLDATYQTFEPLYDKNGTVHVLSRLSFEANPGDLCRIIYGPSGYISIPFETAAPVFFVGYIKNQCYTGGLQWIHIGGHIPGILLSMEAEGARFVEIRDGHISYANGRFASRYTFAAINHVDGSGMADITMFPREVCDDAC